MKTWDIAKLLVESSKSPEDVGQILAMLQDPKEVTRVCELLSSFSDVGPPGLTREAGNVDGNVVAKNGHLPSESKRLPRNLAHPPPIFGRSHCRSVGTPISDAV